MKKLILILLIVNCSLPIVISQWQQMPAFPVSGSAYSVAFINKDTGYVSMDTPGLLRTTNGGQSWVMVGDFRIFNLQFTDSLNGFGSGKRPLGGYILKTTNGGFSWDSISIDPSNTYLNLFFVNKDTGWLSGGDGSFSKIWRTTNGGVTLDVQNSVPGGGYERVFFLKNKVNNEYYGWALNDPSLLRTTNSGVNWNIIYARTGLCGTIEDFYFTDTVNGVIVRGNRCLQTTTDGGFNWSIVNEWNVGSGSHIGMANQNIGWITMASDTIIKTTNFFQSYGKQFHPTSGGGAVFVLDTFSAWTVFQQLDKTTNGGGNYVSVTQISSEVPKQYSLSQNYPNPFNPVTNIKYRIPKSNFVFLKVYDILGKEIQILVNQEQAAGTYEVNWDASKLPSGIYIYKLTTESFTETKKAVLIK